MTVKLILPHWVNNQHVPTVREFYVKIINIMQERDIEYDIVPDHERMHSPTRIDKIVPGLEVGGCYERHDEYDHVISYHTRKPGNINVKISYLPDYFYFDRKGYAGWSEITSEEPSYGVLDSEEVDDEFYRINKNVVENNVSKYEQPDRESGASWPTPYVFLPTQVVGDEVANLAHVPIYDLLKQCIAEIPKTEYHLVVKRHPRCDSDKIEKTLSKAADKPQIHVVENSIHDIITDAAGIVTVNSGVGFEALLQEKPVINFGDTDYQWATTTLESKEAVSDIPAVIDDFSSEDAEKIRRFVVYFLNHFLININDEQTYLRAFERTGIV